MRLRAQNFMNRIIISTLQVCFVLAIWMVIRTLV